MGKSMKARLSCSNGDFILTPNTLLKIAQVKDKLLGDHIRRRNERKRVSYQVWAGLF